MDKGLFLKRLEIKKPSFFENYSYELVPETFLAQDKIPISCKIHGVFHQRAYTHLAGGGCEACYEQNRGNKRALTTEEFIASSKARFGNRFDYSKTKYLRNDVALTITCRRHGDISLTPLQHSWHRLGCQQCSFEIPRENKQLTVLEKARKVHQGKYDYSRVKFTNMNDKVEIICPTHGSFWQGLYPHIGKQNACPKCASDEGRSTTEAFISSAKLLHGDEYDYGKVRYTTGHAKVLITCKKHGDFYQRANSHLAGNKCKKCFIEGNKLHSSEFIQNSRLVHGDKYDYSKVVYLGNKKPVEIICPIHGSFWQKPNSHTSSRSGCRFCADSKGEREVELFLKKYGIEYVREYRAVPHNYRYDFYLPELNVYVEFNGIQHYKPVMLFGGQEGLMDTKKRDDIKKTLALEKGVHLVVIPYTCTSFDAVERALIRKLKKIYVRIYKINGRLLCFKKLTEVYTFFGIPENELVRSLDRNIEGLAEGNRRIF